MTYKWLVNDMVEASRIDYKLMGETCAWKILNLISVYAPQVEAAEALNKISS